MEDSPHLIACTLSLLPAPLQRHSAELINAGLSLSDIAQNPTLAPSINRKLTAAAEALASAQQQGQLTIAITTPEYPHPLLQLPVPPPILFVKGSTTWITPTLEHIAIVGARSASVTDCLFVAQVAKSLSTQGHSIVSGLALGIDGAAHRGALASPLQPSTIAVLAHGLDRVYPHSHRNLAAQILNSGGALISEYPPGTPPLRHHFLARNRIIAALAHTTIVAQAGAKSGSLVTAQVALELGREVCVLTNPSAPEITEGANKLLHDGALSVHSAAEILSLILPHKEPTSSNQTPEIGPSGSHPSNSSTVTIPIADLLRISRFSLSYLLNLELSGEITRLPGNQVSIPKILFDQLVVE